MSQNQNSGQGITLPSNSTAKPTAVPSLPGFAPFPPPAPPPLGPGQGPQPVTPVNGTKDPRVLWEDGHVAIIYAKDFPGNSGMGRSRTRDDIKDALNAPIDDQLQTPPGKGAAHKFIKVWLKDLLARPMPGPTPARVVGRLPVDPKQFKPVVPVIAQSGRFKGQVIPDFPDDCMKCGGKYYQGMFNSIHDTPDGLCPADKAPVKKRGR